MPWRMVRIWYRRCVVLLAAAMPFPIHPKRYCPGSRPRYSTAAQTSLEESFNVRFSSGSKSKKVLSHAIFLVCTGLYL